MTTHKKATPAQTDAVKAGILQSLAHLEPEERRRALVDTHQFLVGTGKRAQSLMRQWGINPKLSNTSDLEVLAMLCTNLQIAHDNVESLKVSSTASALVTGAYDDNSEATAKHIIDSTGAPNFLEPEVMAWLKRWKTYSYARMSVGHKLASALMLTSAPKDAEIQAPWEAWSLYVPNDLLHQLLTVESVARIRGYYEFAVAPDASKFSLSELNKLAVPAEGEKIVNAELTRVWIFGTVPVFVLLNIADRCSAMPFTLLMAYNMQICELIQNYVKGVCLALDKPPAAYRKGVWGPKVGKHRTGKEPVGDTYEFSAPVSVDFRAEVRAITTGTRKGVSPKVQFLVRGHWRNQACGPGRVDRKHLWIEPHWKGDESARMLLRTHVIRDPKPA